MVSVYIVKTECRPDRICRLQNTGTLFFFSFTRGCVENLLNIVKSMFCTKGKLCGLCFPCFLSMLLNVCLKKKVASQIAKKFLCSHNGIYIFKYYNVKVFYYSIIALDEEDLKFKLFSAQYRAS